MRTWTRFWTDELGAVVTAELAMLSTVGVVGAAIGLNVFAKSVHEELSDAAKAFRSLDQSYSVTGFRSCGACVAGSGYVQEDVEKSLAELRAYEDDLWKEYGEDRDRWERERQNRRPDRGRADDRRPDERAKPRLVPKKKRDERRSPDRRPTDFDLDEREQVRTRFPARQQV